MAQVVATRSIQGSFLCPNGGSVSTRSEKILKPASFEVKVLGNEFIGNAAVWCTSVGVWSKPTVRRKTKIVCTIGPSTNTREMIWKLAEAGMNVAQMNMSHGDHVSHKKVINLVKEYNAQSNF